VSGSVAAVSALLCEIELEPAKPMLVPGVLYHQAPFEKIGTLIVVGCVAIAAVVTAPIDEQVAVLIMRAETKRNGPAHAAICAGVENVEYGNGKPGHIVQPCDVSKDVGTLYKIPEKDGGSALGDADGLRVWLGVTLDVNDTDGEGDGLGVWLGVTLDVSEIDGVTLGVNDAVGVTDGVNEMVDEKDGVEDAEG